eukprot:2041571-Pyramimonas_sp.AAC.1
MCVYERKNVIEASFSRTTSVFTLYVDGVLDCDVYVLRACCTANTNRVGLLLPPTPCLWMGCTNRCNGLHDTSLLRGRASSLGTGGGREV